MRRTATAALLILAGSVVASAQGTQAMTASIRGGGGDRGKCTIEVEVDGVAEVEVRGDRGVIHTLQGQPSNWRRFECNGVIPRNPADFRFKGIDGRGRVNLVRDPNSTNGAAVVRIEDPQGGREGYTFDLEWRGGTYSNSPWDNNNNRDRGDWNNGRGYGRNNDDRGFGRNNDDRGFGRNNNAYDMNRSVEMCQDVVRARARRDYGARSIDFRGANANDLRGNRDQVVGRFEANRGEWYDYSCTVNSNTGDIRNVEIRRAR